MRLKHSVWLLAFLPLICSLLSLPALRAFTAIHPLAVRVAVAGLQHAPGANATQTELDFDSFACMAGAAILETVVSAYEGDPVGLERTGSLSRDLGVLTWTNITTEPDGRKWYEGTLHVPLPSGRALNSSSNGEIHLLNGPRLISFANTCP